MSFFPSSLGGKTPPPAPGSKEEDREKEYKDEGIGGGAKEDPTKPDTAGAGDDKGGQVSPVCFTSVFGKVTFLSAQIFIIDSATPPPPSPPPPTSAPVLIGSTVWILNSNSSDNNNNSSSSSSSSTGTTTSSYRTTTTTTRQPSPPKSTAASPPSSSSSRSPKFFGGRVRKKI